MKRYDLKFGLYDMTPNRRYRIDHGSFCTTCELKRGLTKFAVANGMTIVFDTIHSSAAYVIFVRPSESMLRGPGDRISA